MTPLGPEWKRLLDHLAEAGQLAEAEAVLRTAEGLAGTADERALLELERAGVLYAAGRTAEGDAAVLTAASEGDALSLPLEVRAELARAEIEARTDPIAALKRAHAVDTKAAGNGPPHLRLSTLTAVLEFARRAGIEEPLIGLADAVIQQAGFTRDGTLVAAATTLRAELACQLESPAEALRRARDAHADALRLPPSPARVPLCRRAAAVRGRAARLAGEMIEAVEALDEAYGAGDVPPELLIERSLTRQAAGLPAGVTPDQLAAAIDAAKPHDPIAARAALGALLLGEGRPDEAARVAASLPVGPLRLSLDARVALARETPEPARAALIAALPDCTPAERPGLELLLAGLHALADDRVDALELLDPLTAIDGPIGREARIQRARILVSFADYDDAYADAEQAWAETRDALDPRGALQAALVRAACLLVWDRERDALDTLAEAIAFADRLQAGRVAAAGRLEQAMVGLSHGLDADVDQALGGLFSADEDARAARLQLIATLAIARHAAESGDTTRARQTIEGLKDQTDALTSPLAAALADLLPGEGDR